jgi:hypothetical protein
MNFLYHWRFFKIYGLKCVKNIDVFKIYNTHWWEENVKLKFCLVSISKRNVNWSFCLISILKRKYHPLIYGTGSTYVVSVPVVRKLKNRIFRTKTKKLNVSLPNIWIVEALIWRIPGSLWTSPWDITLYIPVLQSTEEKKIYRYFLKFYR